MIFLLDFSQMAYAIQGEPLGGRLHFVDFRLVVVLSAQFSLHNCKSGKNLLGLVELQIISKQIMVAESQT